MAEWRDGPFLRRDGGIKNFWKAGCGIAHRQRGRDFNKFISGIRDLDVEARAGGIKYNLMTCFYIRLFSTLQSLLHASRV